MQSLSDWPRLGLSDVKRAVELGCRISKPVILQQDVDDNKSKDEKPSKQNILLSSNVNVYPICEEGKNRSQILRAALVKKCETLHLSINLIQPCHGAIGGLDPFVVQSKIDNEDSIDGFPVVPEYCYSELPQEDKLFQKVVGTCRTLRFGEEELIMKQQLNPSVYEERGGFLVRRYEGIAHQETMRQYMDRMFYDRIINEGGQLIVFNKSLPVMISRLIERVQHHKKVQEAKIEVETITETEAETETIRLNRVSIFPILADDPFHYLGEQQAESKIQFFYDQLFHLIDFDRANLPCSPFTTPSH